MTAPAVAAYNAAEREIVTAIEAWEYVTLRTPEVRDYLERLLVADVRFPFFLFFLVVLFLLGASEVHCFRGWVCSHRSRRYPGALRQYLSANITVR